MTGDDNVHASASSDTSSGGVGSGSLDRDLFDTESMLDDELLVALDDLSLKFKNIFGKVVNGGGTSTGGATSASNCVGMGGTSNAPPSPKSMVVLE